jgi:hypothetical protein
MLLMTPISTILAVLLLGVNVSPAASRTPTPRQVSPAINTSTLVSDLLAVVSGAGTNSTDTYLTAIGTNTDVLTSYSLQASGASQAARAALVCEASELLFGTSVITPNDPTYTSEEQEYW